MKNSIKQRVAHHAASIGVLFLGCIFVWAAISKITDLSAFSDILKKITWLPNIILVLALFIVPSLELTVGFCLLWRVSLKETLFVGLLLLIVFTFLSVQNALTGVHGCGCFKIGGTNLFDGVSEWWVVARDAALVIICLVIAINPFYIAKHGNVEEAQNCSNKV